MAAWQAGVRIGGKSERKSEWEIDGERERKRERQGWKGGKAGGREGGREAARRAEAGRVIIILQTTAAGTYLYNPSPSLSLARSSPPRATPAFRPVSFHPLASSPDSHRGEIRVHGT